MATTESPSVLSLNRASEFDTVFKQAKHRVSSAEFLVLALPNSLEFSRLGMVVSKRVARTSVNRNRIRRLIRESFRLGFTEAGLDVVVVARPSSSRMENAKTHAALSSLWKKLARASAQGD